MTYVLRLASPCDGIIECEDAKDEQNGDVRICNFDNSYLMYCLGIGMSVIVLTLFIKLKQSKYLNKKHILKGEVFEGMDEDEDIDDDTYKQLPYRKSLYKACPSGGESKLNLALRLLKDKQAKEILAEECEYHQNEAEAICCMKVSVIIK